MKRHILFLSTFTLALGPFGFSQKMEKMIPAEIQQTESPRFEQTERQSVQVNTNEGDVKMSFQGSLFKNGEAFNGNAKLEFTIQIDSSTTWTETHESVPVINGLYSIVLGQFSGLPSNLFYENKEQNLSIKVDDSILGDVTLYAPLSSKSEIPTSTFVPELDLPRDILYHVNVDASNTVRGFQVDMNGKGLKFPIRGNNNSSADDDGFKIAVLGSSIGQGTGGHEGVRGQAFANGRSNTGVLGLAGGEGSGETGYETGSYNTGTTGQAANNAWGNTGVYGLASGSVGVDNIGVAGISAVGDSANFEIENKGVLGRAEGPGINKAIWGRALNGQENWAGWFEGDLFVSGKIISENGISGKLPLEFAGENGNRSINLASEGPEGNDGVLRLANENGSSRVTMFANHYENELDSAQSTDSTNVYKRVYNGAGGLWFGGANGGRSIFMSSNGTNGSNGYVAVSDEIGAERARLGISQFNSGFVRGEVTLNNNTDNRNSILRPDQLYFYNDQGGYPGWFGTYGNSGFSQLIGYDDSNNVTGALLTGFFNTPQPQVYLENENSNLGARLTLNEVGAGSLTLNGSEWNPNIRMGPKEWENSNLPYISMHGEVQLQGEILADSTGNPTDTTYYHPDLIWMEIQRWEDGTEVGVLNLRGTDGTDFGITSHGIDGNAFGGELHLTGNTDWNSDQLNFGGGIDENNNRLEGGLSLGRKHWEEYPENGFIHLKSDEEVKATFEVNKNDSGTWGTLSLKGNTTSNFGVTSKEWEGVGGTDLPYVYLRGSEEVGDTTNGFYLPDLVSIHTEQWSTSQAGNISLSSTDGSNGIRMYGGADFDSNGNINSHIALDGANNNHIYLNGNGDFEATGTVTATTLNQTSDQRFKKDIVTIDGALSKINLLNGYTYFWNKKAEEEKGIQTTNQQIGVLAQELEEVFPQLVTTDKNGYKSVNYASLSAVLIEAIKELTNEVATLKAENTTLKTEVASALTLEQRLEKLELLLGLKSNVSSSAVNNK